MCGRPEALASRKRLTFNPSVVSRAKVGLTASADLVFPVDRARGEVTDSDDEIFLECALAGEASHIVSGDKKHLLKLHEWRGIRIVAADTFLALI